MSLELMDREKWKKTFVDGVAPGYPCPHCKPGTIHVIKESLTYHESPSSKAAHAIDDFSPDWIVEHFHCTFRCGNPSCEGHVHVVGSGSFSCDYDPEHGEAWVRKLQPSFFLPAPRIIDVPPRCPRDVLVQVDAASSLFWSDPAAAGNRIRSAIEALLTHMGVPRTSATSQSGKRLKRRRRLGLSERVTQFRGHRPELADRLDAIKWIGHEGSHSQELTKDDVLDAFEILESVLDDLYTKKRDKVQAIVSQINRRKKPRSRRRRRKPEHSWP